MPDIPTANLFNTLMQIYQATGQTAGPYANLGTILQQMYGAGALGNYQGSLYGYNGSGQPGSIGAPAAPGFPGAPSGPPVVGPVQGGAPAGGGGAPLTPGGSLPLAGSPTYAAPTSSNTLYTPPEGTKIGLGADNTFFDPYAGQVPASQVGHQPGILELNTGALRDFGPAATAGLLNANPYLSDALNYGSLANFDASNPLRPSNVLTNLNTIANDKLNPATFGQLSDQEQRDLSQGARSSLGPGGLIYGNTGDVADLLGRDRYVQQRQGAAEALGGMVEGLNTTQQGQELQRIGMAGNLANQTAANASSSLSSPILQLLGFGSNLMNTATPGSSIENSNAIFNPFQQLGNSVTGFNANANANSAIAGANQDAATQAGWLNLAGNLLSSVGSGAVSGGWGFSDKRLKKNVRKTGKSPSGIEEMEWEYRTDKKGRRYHGTTAQAVEKVAPFAVLEDPVSGIKAVDYSKIDVPFYELNPYNKLKEAA